MTELRQKMIRAMELAAGKFPLYCSGKICNINLGNNDEKQGVDTLPI
jgi:hypothetical protein